MNLHFWLTEYLIADLKIKYLNVTHVLVHPQTNQNSEQRN